MARLNSLMIAFLMLVMGTIQPAAAHTSSNSEIRIDARSNIIAGEVIVPLSEYSAITGEPLSPSPQSMELAKKVIADRMAIFAASGAAWDVTLETPVLLSGEGPADLRAVFRAVPPANASARAFTVEWTMFAADSPGTLAMLTLASDDGGANEEGGRILGAFTPQQSQLEIDLGTEEGGVESTTNVAANMGMSAFLIGVHHILEGYDHLLFLIALMLPAPLIAVGRRWSGRWSGRRPWREAAVHIITIVTAFTVGHSITLVLSYYWPIGLSAVIVESLIALSVLVSALHAIRPIFPGREAAVGFGFGLIHGLAFATLLSNAGLGSDGGAAALIGFTLGIEAVQLGIAACTMPVLLLLAQFPSYHLVKSAIGGAVLVAAAIWLLNRLTGIGSGVVGVLDQALSFGAYGLAGLLLLGIGLGLTRILQGPRPSR